MQHQMEIKSVRGSRKTIREYLDHLRELKKPLFDIEITRDGWFGYHAIIKTDKPIVLP